MTVKHLLETIIKAALSRLVDVANHGGSIPQSLGWRGETIATYAPMFNVTAS